VRVRVGVLVDVFVTELIEVRVAAFGVDDSPSNSFIVVGFNDAVLIVF